MVFTVQVLPWFSFVVVGTGPHRIQPQTQVVPRPNRGLLILLPFFSQSQNHWLVPPGLDKFFLRSSPKCHMFVGSVSHACGGDWNSPSD